MENTLSQTAPTTAPDLLEKIRAAAVLFCDPLCPVRQTDIFYDSILSEQYNADVWLASELRQPIGAYKIRGAWNFISNLTSAEKEQEVITASAGNHAQGIALSARVYGIKTTIYMPENTPLQKIERVRELGGSLVNIVLEGVTYDLCEAAAMKHQAQSNAVFAHPFNDMEVIAGQGTLGLEIGEALPGLDVAICPVGGGGLIAGLTSSLTAISPKVQIVGAEPFGAASLQHALMVNKPERLPTKIDTFVDGASVQKIGTLAFEIIKDLVSSVVCVKNDELKQSVTDLWERPEPLRVELAGALSVSALAHMKDSIKGKTVVCVLSGGNLSATRYSQQVKPGTRR